MVPSSSVALALLMEETERSPCATAARKLAFTSPLGEKQAADKDLLAAFKAKKGDEAATRRKTQVEEEWSSKAKANYARAVELANAAK